MTTSRLCLGFPVGGSQLTPIHHQRVTQSNTKLLCASSTNQATQERELTQHCRMMVRLACHYNGNKLPMQDLEHFEVAKYGSSNQGPQSQV